MIISNMKIYKILLFLLINLSINGLSLMATECDIPKYCEKRDNNIFYNERSINVLICSIKGSSQLRFDIDKRNENIYRNGCNKTDIYSVIIKPGLFESNAAKLSGKSIDFKSLIQYVSTINSIFLLELDSFKGFDLQLFHDSDINRTIYHLYHLKCNECLLRFYIGDKQIKSCQDYYDPTKNFTTQRSIFQFFNYYVVELILGDLTADKICPLVFENQLINTLFLHGDNSFFSRRVIKFSDETFKDLNSTIVYLHVNIGNVEVDFELFHRSVFQETTYISINKKIKSIQPEIFVNFKKLKSIEFESLNLRGFLHRKGIEWIKNINRDLAVNLSDQQQVNECFRNNSVVSILVPSVKRITDLPIYEVFPDEDFCIYRDFPFNQMVIIVPLFEIKYKLMNPKVSCTFLWLIQYYSNYDVSSDFTYNYLISFLIDSEEFKSMSKCNFTHRVSMCNKSDFHLKPIISYDDIGESMKWTKYILNIASYIICLFGFVTNLLVIITISSKKNKAEFKEFNQYKYMRINSICSCLLLSIHFLSWLNECNYPYGVFCSEVRKTLFFQYFKIIVGQILATSLRFMINFAYIEFSFCRLSLIGKDHSKFVKFMSEIGIKKYVSISLFISLILSSVKFFSYRINYGFVDHSYPINYDYESIKNTSYTNNKYFIINFISDFLNYVVFILLHFSMDIGMVIKLRKTLNERLEKSKEYNTKEQQEKKQTENESVLNNAISMVILNTVVGILFKFPTCLYSLIFMNFIVYSKIGFSYTNSRLAYFINNVCIDSYLCDMFFTLADFLYLLHITVQFFFYIRFDKKFKIAFKRIYSVKDSNTVK